MSQGRLDIAPLVSLPFPTDTYMSRGLGSLPAKQQNPGQQGSSNGLQNAIPASHIAPAYNGPASQLLPRPGTFPPFRRPPMVRSFLPVLECGEVLGLLDHLQKNVL